MKRSGRIRQASRGRQARTQGGPGALSTTRWEIALWAALIVLALVLRFWDLGARTFHGDEAVHAGFSWQLADGRGYVHNPLTHGPFQFFGTALIFVLFGDSDYTARVLPALLGAALVALPFFLRGYLGRAGALIAALLLAVSPTLLYFSRFARNDIYIAFFTLALVVCLWRYLAQPRRLYLYLTAGLLALSFATKEVTFIMVAMLLVYLNLMAARELATQMWRSSTSDRPPDESATEGEAQPAPSLRRQIAAYTTLLPTAWLIVAFWPLLGSLRQRLRLGALPQAGHLLVLIGCLSLPLYAATVEKLPFVGDRGYDVAEELVVMRATVLGLMIAAFCLGLMWRWRVWMVCAAIFYAIFIPLFTSFFTNPDGFWTGMWGSLDYWLGQQQVRLGGQPSYYYFMLLPVYEFLPLAFAAGAAAVYVLRGQLRHKTLALAALALVVVLALVGERIPLVGPYRTQVGFVTMIGALLVLPMDSLTRFLFYWTLSALFAFTLAGEKMPWLNVHIALPLSMLAARALGEFLSGMRVRAELPPLRGWAAPAAAGLTAAPAMGILIAVGPGNSLSVVGWLCMAGALAAVGWSARALSLQTAMRVGAGALAAMLLVFTARAAILASWGHPNLLDGQTTLASSDRGDTPVELLVYVQASSDIPVIRDAIDQVAAASGQGVNLPIIIDARDGYSWPWAWYLRKYENLSFPEIEAGFQPPPGSVVLLNWRNRARVDLNPALFTEGIRYHHRWWFPEEYRGLSSAQVMGELVNPSSWENWRRYFIDRTPPSGLPALDAVAYFPRDARYSEVLSATIHKEP